MQMDYIGGGWGKHTHTQFCRGVLTPASTPIHEQLQLIAGSFWGPDADLKNKAAISSMCTQTKRFPEQFHNA